MASDLGRAQQELASAQTKIKELQASITEAKAANKVLEKTQTKHESELGKLEKAISSLKEEHEEVKEKNTELEKQVRAAEKERDKRVRAEVECKSLMKRVAELEEANSKNSQKVETEWRKSLKDTEGKLAKSQAQTKDAQETARAAEARVTTLEKQLTELKDTVASKLVKPSGKGLGKGKGKEKVRIY